MAVNWPRWVAYLSAASLPLLLAQYFLGLWTNVYAPTQFSNFDSGANYSPALNWHIINGDVLFLLAVIALVFAGLSRKTPLVLPAAVLVISIYFAGELGMMYVNSTPNDPIYSFGMGAMFLVALFSAMALLLMSIRAARTPSPSSSASPAPSTSTN